MSTAETDAANRARRLASQTPCRATVERQGQWVVLTVSDPAGQRMTPEEALQLRHDLMMAAKQIGWG